MGPKVTLHIGASKTGTSAIQNFLMLNCKKLGELGYLVPDCKIGGTDRVTGGQTEAFQQLFNRSDSAGIATKISGLVSNPGARNIVISAENLSNVDNYKYFAGAFAGIDMRVVIYIRRQDDFLTSSWKQWYSKKETDINAWLIRAVQWLGHWQRCIEGWEAVVGRDNIVVRLYQPPDLLNGDVVDDFMSILGLELSMADFVRDPMTVNPSYSSVIAPIVSGSRYIFRNEHDNEFYKMVAALTDRFYLEKKKISLISREQRESIVACYDEGNSEICRRYFPDRHALFDDVDHAKYDYLSKDDMQQRQMEFLASLIFSLHRMTAP